MREDRTIHSASERALLPVGTIAVDAYGIPWKRVHDSWILLGGETLAANDGMDVTLTILREGTGSGRTGHTRLPSQRRPLLIGPETV